MANLEQAVAPDSHSDVGGEGSGVAEAGEVREAVAARLAPGQPTEAQIAAGRAADEAFGAFHEALGADNDAFYLQHLAAARTAA